MFKKLLNRLTISLALLGALLLPVMPATVTAQSKADICEGVGIASGTGGNDCAEDPDGPNVNSVIETVVNFLSLIVGVIAVIMIIIGGLKYITSSGDSANVSSAKNTILYAIIGLVIVALAQVIVRFVINKVA